MAELRVSEAVHQPPAGDQADADPRADGNVGKILEVSGRTPAALGERRTVHIGIEADRHIERLREALGDAGIAPTGLGSGSYETVGRGAAAQIERAERGNTERVNRAVRGDGVVQDALDSAESHRRVIAGWYRGLNPDVPGTRAEEAYALRAAQFDAAQQRLRGSHRAAGPAAK
jgi:hypothetical protein